MYFLTVLKIKIWQELKLNHIHSIFLHFDLYPRKNKQNLKLSPIFMAHRFFHEYNIWPRSLKRSGLQITQISVPYGDRPRKHLKTLNYCITQLFYKQRTPRRFAII